MVTTAIYRGQNLFSPHEVLCLIEGFLQAKRPNKLNLQNEIEQ